jgi:hypothetical protein
LDFELDLTERTNKAEKEREKDREKNTMKNFNKKLSSSLLWGVLVATAYVVTGFVPRSTRVSVSSGVGNTNLITSSPVVDIGVP